MALSRSMLKALGIEDEKAEQIISAHSETVEGLKREVNDLNEKTATYREQAEQLPDLQKKLEEAEAKIPTVDYETKWKELSKEFDDYKVQVDTDKAEAEKKSLYRALLRDAGIDEKRLDAIVKVTDLSTVKVEEGTITDADTLKESVKQEWSAFIPQEKTEGADVPTPPATDETLAGADPGTVQRLAERHERLYGKSEKTNEGD